MGRHAIQTVKDEDIFIECSTLTNLIKKKETRLLLAENGVKVKIFRTYLPTLIHRKRALKSVLSFTFYHPDAIGRRKLQQITNEVSAIIYKKHQFEQFYHYISYKEENEND